VPLGKPVGNGEHIVLFDDSIPDDGVYDRVMISYTGVVFAAVYSADAIYEGSARTLETISDVSLVSIASV